MMYGWGWGMGLGWLVMVLFWVFVIAGVVWLVLNASRPRSDRGRALRILEERFARGEIDETEFHARKTAIEEAAR